MMDIILDTIIDAVKLLPFLFLTFLLIEYLEHKINNAKIITKTNKFGPLIGSILGAFPQCGFSASATNFYITRIISLGTLISVYLSTSDEMLPIMLASGVEASIIIKIIGLKVLIGLLCGFIIDIFLRNKDKKIEISELCEHDHCHCERGIIFPALKHTINTIIFILVVSFIINLGFFCLGEDNLSNIFLKNSIFSSFISSLIGLIPNCGASIMITELYLNNTISFGATMAGLLTGSGVGLLILFKNNKNLKENIGILGIIYGIGALSGIIIDVIGIVI